MLKEWAAKSTVPSVLVDGGNSCQFDNDQQQEMSVLTLDVLQGMGYTAMALGDLDLSPSWGAWEKAVAPVHLPWISANLRFADSGARVVEPFRIVTLPASPVPLRIAFIGMTNGDSDFLAFGPAGRTVVTSDPAEELRSLVPELRKQADLVVVISAGDEGARDRILRLSPDVDLLLLALGFRSSIQPTTSGKTKVLINGDRGRIVVRTGIRRGAGGWEFEFERIALADGKYAEDKDIAARVEEVVTRLNDRSRDTMKAWAASQPAPSIAPYVGAIKCSECHAKEFESWSKSKHAHAMEALVKERRDYTLECVNCHVTGTDGAFKDPASTPQLVDVQCERCHGAGSDHLKDPSAPYGATGKAETCGGCHTPEFDPTFEYASYWQKIAH